MTKIRRGGRVRDAAAAPSFTQAHREAGDSSERGLSFTCAPRVVTVTLNSICRPTVGAKGSLGVDQPARPAGDTSSCMVRLGEALPYVPVVWADLRRIRQPGNRVIQQHPTPNIRFRCARRPELQPRVLPSLAKLRIERERLIEEVKCLLKKCLRAFTRERSV